MAHPGHTTNISTTGMFLASNSPQAPGTRLRIEVIEGTHGFVVEGVVAHARKVRGDMMRLSQPGMGIRFLAVEELVRELIPMLPGETEEIPPPPFEPGAAETLETEPPPRPEPLPEPAPAAFAPPLPPAPPAPSAPSAPPPHPTTASIPRPVEGAGVFNVQFLGPAEFLEIFRRDLVHGGLFISTRYPGRLQETVRVDLLPPIPFAEVVSFRARVVQRFEPHGEDFARNLLSGMGVEILDLPAVLERLTPFVERLRQP